MTLLPPDLGNLAGAKTDRKALSHTRVSSLLSCARRFQHQYIDRIEPVERPAALRMGSAFHKTLETGDFRDGMKILAEQTTASNDQLMVAGATIKAAAEAYLRRWPEAAGVAEFEWRVRIRHPETGVYHPNLDVMGYSDELRVLLTSPINSYKLIEAKLMGQVSSNLPLELRFDRQLSLNAYGIWRITGKIPSISYRVVRKPSIRQKKDESLSSFVARIHMDYRERPDFYLQELTPTRTLDDLAEIERDLWSWAEDYEREMGRTHHSQDTSRCSDYGGCPYLAICSRQPEAHTHYTTKEAYHGDTLPTPAV